MFLWNYDDGDVLSSRIRGVAGVLHWMEVVEVEVSLMKMRWHSWSGVDDDVLSWRSELD